MRRPPSLLWIVLAVIAAGLVLLIVNNDAGTVFGMESGKFSQLLQLAVWGTVLAAAVVVSRRSLGPLARNLAIWLGVVLVLVAGYQYRYELQDVASRVTAGLVPGSPYSAVAHDGGNLVMLDKAANGHFEVRTRIDGQTVTALVDTGASRTVLSSADAARLGFEPANLDYVIPVVTANGQARAARITVPEIAVGSIVRKNMPILVAPANGLDQSLLGMDFISTLSGFEFRGDRMILRD